MPKRPSPSPPAKPRTLTFRAVALGLGLIPFNAFWIVYSEVIRYAAHPTTTSLFFNVIFCLAVLVAINAALRRYAPRWAFSQGELLTIYLVLSLGSCMVGHDLFQVLISVMAHPFWFATPDNRWQSLFFDVLPRHLMMPDLEVLRGFYLGESSLYRTSVVLAWLRPVAIWIAFFTVLIGVMMCLNVIWRRQWVVNERLSFPIVELPLRMTDESFALFRHRGMWIGFALAGLVNVANTLHMNAPSWPEIPTRVLNFNQFLTERPWNALGSTPIQFLPFAIGLGYLLPLDLSFSCWFFFWWWKGQSVLTAIYGWNDGRPQFPYIAEQSAGAYLGVALFVIWVSRHYLRQVFRRALGRPSDLDDATEPLSYRAALIGLVVGVALLLAFLVAHGVTPWVAVAFLAIYLMLSISVSRMRAELGSPAHDLHYAGPDHLLSVTVGARNLSKPTLAFFALSWGFNRAYRSHPMPHQSEGFKLAQVSGLPTRPLLWVMLLASLWGAVWAFWALLHVYYVEGAATANVAAPFVPQVFGREPYQRLARWLTPPGPPVDPAQTWFIAGGLGFSLFLTAMRGIFLWWPFHPVGLAVSSSWAMGYLWLSLMTAWVLKFAILRAGGLKGYRNALPFFLGLILGEFVVGGAINLLGLAFGFQLYRFWG